MGTRWQVFFKDGDEHIGTMYGQWDGYPSGAGSQIKKFLADGEAKIINGFSGQNNPQYFNGMGCLAAYLIGAFKEGIGSYYLSGDTDPRDFSKWTEFHYVLSGNRPDFGLGDDRNRDGEPVMLKIYSRYVDKNDGLIYDGPLADFDPQAAERLAFGEDEEEEIEEPEPEVEESFEEFIERILGYLPNPEDVERLKQLKETLNLMAGDAPSLGGDRANG